MERILVLDDDTTRHTYFKRKFSEEKIVCVETVDDCILKLTEGVWDSLWLDHDLGGEAFCPSDEKSGYEVAKWLERHPNKQPPAIFLHSMNPAGVNNMKAALPNAIIIPFFSLLKV